MEFYGYFRDFEFPKDLSKINIHLAETINESEMDDTICRGIFTKETILEAIQTVSFTLFCKNNDKIQGVLCVSVYNRLWWEITFICASSGYQGTGVGTMLINKLIEIAHLFANEKAPITIYGMGIEKASQKLYQKMGFNKKNEYVVYSGGHTRRYHKGEYLKKTRAIYRRRNCSFQKRNRSRKINRKKYLGAYKYGPKNQTNGEKSANG